jgi:hypothetical protein
VTVIVKLVHARLCHSRICSCAPIRLQQDARLEQPLLVHEVIAAITTVAMTEIVLAAVDRHAFADLAGFAEFLVERGYKALLHLFERDAH